jgi:UV DNA damage endonuclease|tara:strand:- start:1289 stop:2134 length:846 start_codon:yes stop_codon:yes gene_type:complete
MTYKRFSSLDRTEALSILGSRILNNMEVTNATILHCAEHDYCYRISSNLFPLITYRSANITLSDLPQYTDILQEIDNIAYTIQQNNVRISCHPSEFNVLASTNTDAVDRTVTELNFYSNFLDMIGCPADYNCPMNLHINNRQGSNDEIVDRFIQNYNRLNNNCRNRLVIENDDKTSCWSVKQLIKDFYPKTNIPITFDFLHHACHPDGWTEQQALEECYMSWEEYRPLFHYSENIPDHPNPRKHADYGSKPFSTYGLDFDLDMELKMKDKAIAAYTGGVLV